jgi:hypothetical protein
MDDARISRAASFLASADLLASGEGGPSGSGEGGLVASGEGGPSGSGKGGRVAVRQGDPGIPCQAAPEGEHA